jgi:hypothetical protein
VIPEDLSLEIGAADLGAFEANLTDALRRHADDPEGIDLLRLLLQFQKLSSPTVSELESLSQGPFSRLAVLSLEALCRASGDPTPFVSKLIAMLVEFDTKAPSDLASIGDELSDVGDTIANQATSADLEGLERLANSRTGALRWSSMLAVRRLRNPNTVPFLVTALDSEDDMVQYEAVISLAEITRQYGDFAPGKGLYDQNPAKYKGMWKDWYQRQGGKTAVTGGGPRPQ